MFPRWSVGTIKRNTSQTWSVGAINERKFRVFVLEMIETLDVIPRKFLVKLVSANEIWEVRVQYGNNIFRLLGFLDGENLIVLTHAFTKKTQKAPKKEIKIAEQRKTDFLSRRRKS